MFSVIQILILKNKMYRKYSIKYIEHFRIEKLHLQLVKIKFRSSKNVIWLIDKKNKNKCNDKNT